MKYTILLEIYHYRMHDTLVLVLVISLDFILHYIVIIFSKVLENDTLSVISSLLCLRCRAWLFAMKECAKVVNTVHQKLDEIVHISCVYLQCRSADAFSLAVLHLLINL